LRTAKKLLNAIKKFVGQKTDWEKINISGGIKFKKIEKEKS
jgi:hypothetical protein